jgi:D-3-phosphoglycerate dehydrogenase / 2-oxoglutarate reductase
MLRIAVIGDRFITPPLVSRVIDELVKPVVGSCAIRTTQLDWPDDTPIQDEELAEYVGDPRAIADFVADAQVVVTQLAPISRHLLEHCPALAIIAAARGGPVSVNMAAATARGIPVVYSPGGNAQAVAEFTIGLILAESKHIARAHAALKRGEWRVDAYYHERSPHELRGQIVGIIGFGHIGQLLMPYLLAFGLHVLVYDPYVNVERCQALGAQPTDLAHLLAESDIVTLHARVTPETRGLMGAAEFAQMKRGATFINCARGPLVDYDALYQALTSGHLAGAALDNFALEPPPAAWPLLQLDNVTLTPHIAGSSRETAQRKVATILTDVANFYARRPLNFCANPIVLSPPYPSPEGRS